MALQDPQCLVLDALSILNDPRPNPAQPVMQSGIWLQWRFGKERAFPLGGYYLFRRMQPPPLEERCVANILAGMPLRSIDTGVLQTTLGRFTAATPPLTLTDAVAPQGGPEIAIRGDVLRFDLPPNTTTNRTLVKVAFRAVPVEPPVVVDFRGRKQTDGPNGLTESGIRFEVFATDGLLPRTRIRANAQEGSGLECNPRMVITLPRPAASVSLYIRRRQTDPALLLKAFNHDDTLAFASPKAGADWIRTTVEGTVTRILINAPGDLTLLHVVEVRYAVPSTAVQVSGIRANELVHRETVEAPPGTVRTFTIDKTIDAVQIVGGPALLVDLCYFAAVTAPAKVPWARVPGFTYPLALPITHPAYPASSGAESLSTRRQLAAQRVRYGTAADALQAAAPVAGTGTITLTPGSVLVRGEGTAWDESLAGRMLYPAGVDTAYAVMTVLAPDRLVISRRFGGVSVRARIAYATSPATAELAADPFAQLHDQLGALLDSAGAMGNAAMPPVIDAAAGARTATVTDRSKTVKGNGTAWTKDLEGLLFESGANAGVYRITRVDPAAQTLELHAEYIGAGATGGYRITSRSPNNRIEEEQAIAFRPIDLVELAAFSPAYAQILGLACVDADVQAGRTYDYMLLADHSGKFGRDPNVALQWLNGAPDFKSDAVDGAQLTIAHNGTPALAAPASLQIYTVPAGRTRMLPDRPDLGDSDPALAIPDLASWRTQATPPLMLIVTRAALGNAPQPPAPPFTAVPVQVGDPFLPSPRPASTTPATPGWPDPSKLHFFDTNDGSGLDVGWYLYRVTAIDAWGRYSAPSAPIPWHDPVDGKRLHAYAVQVRDLTPPPPPTRVMAWVLEEESVADPMLVDDAEYRKWRAAAGPKARGLRVRWNWPWTHVLRAPDLGKFRIYVQTRPINARFHRIVSVAAAPGNARQSVVTLAAADGAAPNAYAGAALQLKDRAYPIEASTGGANLVLRVTNGGPAGADAPPPNADATIVLPIKHPLHRELLDPRNWERYVGDVAGNTNVTYDIDVLEDATVDSGNVPMRGPKAKWTASTRTLKLDVPVKIDGLRPGVDRVYLKVTPNSTPDQLRHYYDIVSVDPAQSSLVLSGQLGFLTGSEYAWSIGTPLRTYETFLTNDLSWLPPSLAEPVVYATIGVSAIDKRVNEGLIGGPVTVFRIHRQPVDAPADDAWTADRLLATRADYHGVSRFTVHYPKPDPAKVPHYRAVIFRTSDETLFQVDAEKKSKRSYPLTALNDAVPTHWSPARRAGVASLFTGPVKDYAALSDDALSVLGNLPGNEEAFAQLTIEPVPVSIPDFRGPDDPAAYVPRAAMSAWTDSSLPGRVRNRYLYKVAFIDSAQARGPLSKASPPVHLPKVVPPRTPVITKITSGERSVTLHWAANRESDLAGYRVYRTDNEGEARDPRLMTLTGTALKTAVSAEDSDLIGGRRYFYRVTAFDTAGNESAPTAVHAGIPVDTRVPNPPLWADPSWLLRRKTDRALLPWPAGNVVPAGHDPVLRLGWVADPADAFFVLTRRARFAREWRAVTEGPAARFSTGKSGEFQWLDEPASAGASFEYRLRVRSSSGVWSTAFREVWAVPPG